MTKNERDLRAVKKVRSDKAAEVRTILDKVESENRKMDEDERAQVGDLTKELDELRRQQDEVEANLALEKKVDEASKGMGHDDPIQIDPKVAVINEPPKSLGEQFTSSKAYQQFFGAGGKAPSGDWKMDAVELQTKATMQSGGTLSGAGPYQQYVPGIIEVPAQAPTVASLLPSQVATAPQIQFFKERIATNNAAGVAEAAGKPESVIDFQADSNSLAKIATYLPVSDEMLEDAPQIQAYLNNRLAMFVRTEEDQQIISGAGSGSNELEGFVDNYALNGVGTAGGGAYSATSGTAFFRRLLKTMNEQRGSSQLDPDALIMHPTQFGSILGFYDTAGQYYGGGPLSPGAYGAGRQLDSSRLTAGWSVWNVPIHVTTAINAGSMLLGNFREGAALWRKGGISVSASNSHSDFFKKNLTAIRAEERLALTVYRPQAFTVIRWL